MNRDYSRAIPEKWIDKAKVCEALGHEHRQRILLTFEKGEEISIKDLVEVSSLKRTAVVYHLQILEEAKVLTAEKRGKFVYYKINPDVIINMCEHLIGYAQDLKV